MDKFFPEEGPPYVKKRRERTEDDELEPDNHPLSKQEIAELIRTASQAYVMRDGVTENSVHVRLTQGIRGYICLSPDSSPLAEKEGQLDRMFVEGIRRGAGPDLVDQLYQLMQ